MILYYILLARRDHIFNLRLTRCPAFGGHVFLVWSCPPVLQAFKFLKFEIEKFYPVPGIEPGPLALRASALPLRHPGELLIQGRINEFVPILSDLRTTTNSVVLRHIEACIHMFE